MTIKLPEPRIGKRVILSIREEKSFQLSEQGKNMPQKTLTQNDIEAIVSAAKTASAELKPGRKAVAHCDFGQASQLSAGHLRAVTSLHESFVRRLTTSLGAYLRVGFEMNLVSAEKLTFDEYLAPIGDFAYFASINVLPVGARAALQVDLSLVYPMVDLVLGGRGEPVELRGMTEVEEQIFETVVRLMARDLQTTWASFLALDIQFEQRLHRAQVQSLMLPVEKVLSLRFQVHLPEATGSLSLAIPAAVANALLRKLSTNLFQSAPIPSPTTQSRLRERVLQCELMVDLSLPSSRLPVRDLVSLEPGGILTFPKRVHEPVHLIVGGKPVFLAFPVCNGAQRAARVVQCLPIPTQNGTETK